MSEFDAAPIWAYDQGGAPETFATASGRVKFVLSRVPGSTRTLLIAGIGSSLFETVALGWDLQAFPLDPSEIVVGRLRSDLDLRDRTRDGTITNMPFEAGSLDAVIVSEVPKHLGDSQLELAASELLRVPSPRGRLLVRLPIRVKVAPQLVFCPRRRSAFHRWGHQQSFDRGRVSKVLSPPVELREIRQRPFITCDALNWKGRPVAVVRAGLSWVKVRRSTDRLFVLAAKS